MDKKIGIIGVGQTPFEISSGENIKELAFESFKRAINDSGITPDEIDSTLVSYAEEYDKQRGPWSAIIDYLDLNPKPGFGVSAHCASSSVGVWNAWNQIASGLHDIVAVIGFQKMSELSSNEAQEKMMRASDLMWESPYGVGMPHAYSFFARKYFQEYKATNRDLAKVRVKSSHYSKKNPLAAVKKDITIDDVINSNKIADPLTLYDCCRNADGASCVILGNEKKTKEKADIPIWIKGLGLSTNTIKLSKRKSHLSTGASNAANISYKRAGVNPEDIDVAEVHDCFTIAELMAYEDLGFCEKGKAPEIISEEETYIGGKIPVNVDGGLLGKGHPVGATGGSQIRTITLQLRNEAHKINPKIQVDGAKTGLVHNVGGTGNIAAVTILGRET